MSIENIKSAIESSGFKTRETREGFQCQCPGHNGKALSLYVAEKEDGKVVMFCQSYQCKAADILGNVGLKIAELFPADDTFNKEQYRKQQTQVDIENECIYSYLVLTQIPVMEIKGTAFSDADKQSITRSIKTIKKHNFTQADYLAIEARKQAQVDAQLSRQGYKR